MKYILGGKEDKFYAFDEFAIEFKNKETGELTVFSAIFGKAPEVTADFPLEQHECTRIKGAMYFFDVPEEVSTANQYGDRVFYVGYRSELMYGPPNSFYEKGSGSYAIDGPSRLFL